MEMVTAKLNIKPSLDDLKQTEMEGGLAALATEVPADLATPVSVFLRLRTGRPAFLLESVEQGTRTGRYSFIGVEPSAQITIRGSSASVLEDGRTSVEEVDPKDPFAIVKRWLAVGAPMAPEGMPPFLGGAVGFVGYDMVRMFEPKLGPGPEATPFDPPDASFMLCNTLIAFDHAKRKLIITALIPLGEGIEDSYADGVRRIERVLSLLSAPLPHDTHLPSSEPPSEMGSTHTAQEYGDAVRAAKEYIAAGDIFQVVLSQRLQRYTNVDPFAIYRALRMVNPSPYMFYLDLPDDLHLIGSSPEVLVRLENGQATVRPLAGTRPRGATAAEDDALGEELLADPKERAEHVMLVDLGRNDLGRVCTYGTVRVPRMLEIERYSHVMHIVSDVVGELAPDRSAFDLLQATFPAGTVSGAPKVRAMEIIDELEARRRGPYAGAVGYVGYDGNMDTCIAIRTIVMQNQVVKVQAGAGIVADSNPQREYEETLHKARALAEAIRMAEAGLG